MGSAALTRGYLPVGCLEMAHREVRGLKRGGHVRFVSRGVAPLAESGLKRVMEAVACVAGKFSKVWIETTLAALSHLGMSCSSQSKAWIETASTGERAAICLRVASRYGCATKGHGATLGVTEKVKRCTVSEHIKAVALCGSSASPHEHCGCAQ